MITRRKALVLFATVGIAPSVLAHPANYLLGTFYLRCPNPNCWQIDRVDDGTAQHACSKDGTQMFQNGKVTMMCPNNHPNEVTVSGQVSSVKCRICGTECRRN
jgi:hypothetical protein